VQADVISEDRRTPSSNTPVHHLLQRLFVLYMTTLPQERSPHHPTHPTASVGVEADPISVEMLPTMKSAETKATHRLREQPKV
jgi:hypothetical protein